MRRYHLTAVSIKSTINKCWRVPGGKGTLPHCCWESKVLTAAGKKQQQQQQKGNRCGFKSDDVIWQPASWANIQGKSSFRKTGAPHFSPGHCLQPPRHANIQNVHPHTNRYRRCATYIQCM